MKKRRMNLRLLQNCFTFYGTLLEWRISGWSRIMKFEDAGRAVDRELEKLRKFLAEEIRPETRSEMAEFLRRASDRLTRLADRLEKAKGKKQ